MATDPTEETTPPAAESESDPAAEDTKRIERMMQVLGLGDRAALDAWADAQEKPKPEETPAAPTADPEKASKTSASTSALDLALAGSARDAVELEQLRREKAEREVTAVISSGRALESEREVLMALRLSDPALFTRLSAARAPVVPLGRDSRVEKAAPKNPNVVDIAELSEPEKRVAMNLKQGGFAPAEINEAIAKMRSGGA